MEKEKYLGSIRINKDIVKNIKNKTGIKNDKKFEKLIQNYVYSIFYLLNKQYFDIEKKITVTDSNLSELLNKAVS